MLTNQIQTEMKSNEAKNHDQHVSMTNFINRNKNEHNMENENDNTNQTKIESDSDDNCNDNDNDNNDDKNLYDNKNDKHDNDIELNEAKTAVDEVELVEFDPQINFELSFENIWYNFDDYFHRLGNEIDTDQQLSQIEKTVSNIIEYHVNMTKVECTIGFTNYN